MTTYIQSEHAQCFRIGPMDEAYIAEVELVVDGADPIFIVAEEVASVGERDACVAKFSRIETMKKWNETGKEQNLGTITEYGDIDEAIENSEYSLYFSIASRMIDELTGELDDEIEDDEENVYHLSN